METLREELRDIPLVRRTALLSNSPFLRSHAQPLGVEGAYFSAATEPRASPSPPPPAAAGVPAGHPRLRSVRARSSRRARPDLPGLAGVAAQLQVTAHAARGIHHIHPLARGMHHIHPLHATAPSRAGTGLAAVTTRAAVLSQSWDAASCHEAAPHTDLLTYPPLRVLPVCRLPHESSLSRAGCETFVHPVLVLADCGLYPSTGCMYRSLSVALPFITIPPAGDGSGVVRAEWPRAGGCAAWAAASW